MQPGESCIEFRRTRTAWDNTKLRNHPNLVLDRLGIRCANPDDEATCPRVRCVLRRVPPIFHNHDPARDPAHDPAHDPASTPASRVCGAVDAAQLALHNTPMPAGAGCGLVPVSHTCATPRCPVPRDPLRRRGSASRAWTAGTTRPTGRDWTCSRSRRWAGAPSERCPSSTQGRRTRGRIPATTTRSHRSIGAFRTGLPTRSEGRDESRCLGAPPHTSVLK